MRASFAFDEHEMIDLSALDQPKELKIGSGLSTDERDSLLQFLNSYLDVLAWSYKDMQGLDPFID